MSKSQTKYDDLKSNHGKKPYHKLKPYVVLQYLLKETDENHVANVYDIIGHLNKCGIYAERRSIYKDVEAINQIMWMLENDSDIEEAEEVILNDEFDNEKFIVYDKSRKGYYVKQRHYDLNDIRLLAECVYSSKFISQGQANRLADVICNFVSTKQAQKIKHDSIVVDRVKTTNTSVLNNISIINDAMSTNLDGLPHTPSKISFKYIKHNINDIKQEVERRHGETYVVSPYLLIIDNGNYYLLAFDDRKKKIITFRLDRMKRVSLLKDAREGEEVFKEIDLNTYTQRVFSMYSGEQQRVTLQFINSLLDTVIDRFGTKNAFYSKIDDRHFQVFANVDVSPQFFGWLCGFGKKARIIAPDDVVKQFTKYIEDIKKMY